FGPVPAFRALLAEAGDEVLGVAMYSPVFSTVRAAPGLYVSDLWVSSAARGRGLGKRLLQAVARDAEEAWGARFLRLVVYEENPDARRFYDRLGFSADPQDIVMTLDETGLNALKGQG
ncbi:MAG: GNAT family N-acetyltransferase, partial [Paracoccaceae bacterium]